MPLGGCRLSFLRVEPGHPTQHVALPQPYETVLRDGPSLLYCACPYVCNSLCIHRPIRATASYAVRPLVPAPASRRSATPLPPSSRKGRRPGLSLRPAGPAGDVAFRKKFERSMKVRAGRNGRRVAIKDGGAHGLALFRLRLSHAPLPAPVS